MVKAILAESKLIVMRTTKGWFELLKAKGYFCILPSIRI
jgi:hypothetical protein